MAKSSNRDITIINIHTHVNSIKHAPLRLRLFIYILWPVKWLLRILPPRIKLFDRATKFLEIGVLATQSKVFEILRSHYPGSTKFVLLSMDMRYMGGGPPAQPYELQLENLAAIKKQFPLNAYPFVCVDPRRPDIYNIMRRCLEEYEFQGIKIYPSFGYLPFPFPYNTKGGVQVDTHHRSVSNEAELVKIYEYAQEHRIPVLTHTTPGGLISYRRRYSRHPVTRKWIWPTRKAHAFQMAHPRNYSYLLEQFPDLKICLAHFGGHGDWVRHLSDPLEPYDSPTISLEGKEKIKESMLAGDLDYYEIYLANGSSRGKAASDMRLVLWYQRIFGIGRFVDPVWNPNNLKVRENTWLNAIRSLLKDDRYPNVYADISYNAFDFETLAYLKLFVEESTFKDHILFGTDFPVVRMQRSEKEFSISMRAFLGEDNFRLIAEQNPRAFLDNDVNPFK